jgi:AcrR family transcriptional regulator
MPRVVAEYRSKARDRIVDAAQRVFRSKGFRSSTMEDVAKEIGVSKGAIYLYFPTKIALLAEVQKRTRERMLASWEGLLESGDVAEGIAAVMDQVFSGEIDPGVWHELLGEAATNREVRAALKEDHREDIRAMRDFLRRLEERGRVRSLEDRETVASIILALLQAAVVDVMLLGEPPEARRRVIRSLRYLLEPR